MTICMICQVKHNNADESIAMEDKWKELPHMQVLLPLTIALGLGIKRGLGGQDVTSFYSLGKKKLFVPWAKEKQETDVEVEVVVFCRITPLPRRLFLPAVQSIA